MKRKVSGWSIINNCIDRDDRNYTGWEIISNNYEPIEDDYYRKSSSKKDNNIKNYDDEEFVSEWDW